MERHWLIFSLCFDRWKTIIETFTYVSQRCRSFSLLYATLDTWSKERKNAKKKTKKNLIRSRERTTKSHFSLPTFGLLLHFWFVDGVTSIKRAFLLRCSCSLRLFTFKTSTLNECVANDWDAKRVKEREKLQFALVFSETEWMQTQPPQNKSKFLLPELKYKLKIDFD